MDVIVATKMRQECFYFASIRGIGTRVSISEAIELSLIPIIDYFCVCVHHISINSIINNPSRVVSIALIFSQSNDDINNIIIFFLRSRRIAKLIVERHVEWTKKLATTDSG